MPDDGADNAEATPEQQAGQDSDIAKRLRANPSDEDAKLDAGLDESMDASDPPSMTAPKTTMAMPLVNPD